MSFPQVRLAYGGCVGNPFSKSRKDSGRAGMTAYANVLSVVAATFRLRSIFTVFTQAKACGYYELRAMNYEL